MRCSWLVSLAMTMVLGVLLSGCQPIPQNPRAGMVDPSHPPSGADFEVFDPNNFDDQSTNFTNEWMPWKPGMHWIFEGEAIEGDERIPHRIEYTVTDLTKMVNGVRTVVIWLVDYSEGELVEAEVAFFAQGKDGSVWYFGEHPEAFENGVLVEAPTWFAGIQGAHPGIAMPADPQFGTPSYSQGWGPGVNWTDRAIVGETLDEVCNPVGCFKDVLVIDEYNHKEAGTKLKLFARGVGNIGVSWKGATIQQEEMELVESVVLDADELAEVRRLALELEAHAYEISPDVYGQTQPMDLPAGVEAPQPAADDANTANEGNTTQPVDAAEIVVYAIDIPADGLYELDLSDDPASPGGKLIDLPNFGDELDPPPENDPSATFTIQVQEGLAYRCWVHMKVGASEGVSTANRVYVQISEAEDADGNVILLDNSGSYLTAQGPEEVGWVWVPCDFEDETVEESLIRFGTTGEVTVRIQAGMEGVGFDQFVLSSADYLEDAPTEAIVEK